MEKKINPYWLLGCIIAVIIVLISTLQLIPENSNKYKLEDKEIFEKSNFHLKNIASNSHYYGSVEKERTQEYIISVIEKNGYNPFLQKGPIISELWSSKKIFAIVENIYVELPGKTDDKICLVCHYDSVPYGPGAADDSVAVSSSLAYFETIASEIKKGNIPSNTIIFLFTDAEEIGLLGADYFVKNYENIETIKVILNLEARGNQGKSILFQSNDNNGDIIKQYSKYDKKLIGFSYANDIYERMPNSTDFSVFLNKKINGLNFAFIQNSIVYHNPLDNIENLSNNSFFETNLKIKNFLNAFKNYKFNVNTKSKNSAFIYFTVFGRLIIFNKVSFFIFLMVLTIIFLILMILSFIKKRFTIKFFFISVLQNLILFVLTGLFLFITRFILYLVFPVLNLYFVNPYHEFLFFLIAYCFSFLILHLLVNKFTKLIDYNSFYIASMMLTLILTFVFLKIIPGISIIFLVNTIAFFLIEFTEIIFETKIKKWEEKIYYLLHFSYLIIPISIGIPFAYLSYVALGLKNITLTFIGLFSIVLFFAGNYKKIALYDRRIVASFLILMIVVLMVFILLNLDFNEQKPMLSSISIQKNDDTSQLSILISANEIKYSNNPWHKSIISLGTPILNANYYSISEIKEVQFPKYEFFKIISYNQNKKFKEYEIEIYSNFWSFTLPENSQIFIKDIANISFDKVSTFNGYTPYNQKIKLKIRTPLSQILKYSFGNYLLIDEINKILPKRPKEIIGVHDKIIETGTLK